MSNKNTEYEKLVAEFYQAMLNADGYETLKVEHDVVIEGKSGAKHQIDVFWEFKAAGNIYRTCVECKNYKSSVKKSHVATFSTVLEDIGNANGVIVTTEGFQKGAIQLAAHKNIRLVLVNNLLKQVNITALISVPEFTDWKFTFNSEQVKELMKEKGLERYNMNHSLSGVEPLYDSNGEFIYHFGELINNHSKVDGVNVITPEGCYIKTDLGLVMLDSVQFHMSFRRDKALPIEWLFKVNEDAKAILEDFVSNNIHYLNDDGRISEKNA